MIQKSLLFFVLAVLLPAVPVFAQESEEGGDFWICPGVETAMYSLSGPAYGGGLSLGYGREASIGFKAVYFSDTEGLSTLELGFLLRWYFLGRTRYSNPFVQFSGGPVLFFSDNTNAAITTETGTISAGLSLGWRLILKDRWFVEPSIRAGYPYFAGAGLSAGFCF